MPEKPEIHRSLGRSLTAFVAIGSLAISGPGEVYSHDGEQSNTARTKAVAQPISHLVLVAHAPETAIGAEISQNLGTFEATCYNLRGRTASGKPAGPGSIAVDPRVIPLGTRLEVEQYGRGDARDTGGAIKGRRIDVWKPTRQECMKWGRRKVEVHKIK